MRRIAVSFRNGLPAGTIQAFTPTASDSDHPFPLCPAGPQPSVKLGQAQQGQDGVLRLHKKDEYHASEGAFNLTQTSGFIHVFNFTTTSDQLLPTEKIPCNTNGIQKKNISCGFSFQSSTSNRPLSYSHSHLRSHPHDSRGFGQGGRLRKPERHIFRSSTIPTSTVLK